MTVDLFETPEDRVAELGQYFTPRWVAEAVVERHFAHLGPRDRVLEPSCGPGHFLLALPDEVDALGVELDPVLAAQARAATGREIICGDFLRVDIPGPVTHIVGNPPFSADLVHGFLDRAHTLLPDGGTVGFLLPSYILQTSSKVALMNRKWSISAELMPRNIFPRLKLPLVFSLFRKDRERTLVGFFLFRETEDVTAMPRAIRAALEGLAAGSVWRRAVRLAFVAVGDTVASLEALYAAVERPTLNQHWREKVRQTLQVYPEFSRADDGRWKVVA
jgi:adenine-specific DNA-methyltransferase